MRFTLQKCRKTIYWTILFAVISITGIPTANALVIGGRNVGILCGPPHSEPIRADVGSTFRYITASVTGNVLKAGTADRRIIRHFATIRSVTPNGTIAWKRALAVQSVAVVWVDLDDEFNWRPRSWQDHNQGPG